MKTELILKFDFTASHSLENFEKPHPHIWRVEVGVTGEPIKGKIIDMFELRATFESVIAPLKDAYLNESKVLDPNASKFPTCETLSAYFYGKFEEMINSRLRSMNPTLKIKSVMVALCEMDGTERGAARLFANV